MLYKKNKNPDKTSYNRRYNELRKSINEGIKRAKYEYNSKQLEKYKDNSSKYWGVVKEIVGWTRVKNKTLDMIQAKDEGGNVIRGKKARADYMIEGLLDFERPTYDWKSALGRVSPCDQSAFILPTCLTEIIIIVNKLRNSHSTGIDGVSNYVIKNLPVLFPIYVYLGNKMFDEAYFPSCLKEGKIVLVHKKGSTKELSNYRPLTLLNSMSKIFENLILRRMESFLEQNNLVSDRQFGFTKNRSTDDALLDVISYIQKQLSLGNFVVGISVDIKRAFEYVPKKLLVEKL